jgi:hypothetical protein
VSSANLKKFLNKVAIPHFKKRAGDKGQRKQVAKEKGQIFVIDEAEYLDEYYKIGKAVGLTKQVLDTGKTQALSIISLFGTSGASNGLSNDRLKQLKELLKDKTFLSKIKTKGKRHLFIIFNYDRIQEWKKPRGKFNKSLTAVYNDLGADAEKSKYAIGGDAGKQKKLGISTGVEDLTGFQLGHGDQGTAVSGLTAREIKEKAERTTSLNSTDKDKISEVFAEVDDDLKISLHHEFVFQPNGKFKKDYVLILSLQSASLNQKDKDREVKAFNKLQKDLKLLAEDENSTRLRDAIRLSLMHSMAKGKFSSTKTKTQEKFNEHSNAKDKKTIKRKTSTGIARMASLATKQQVRNLKGNKRQNTRRKGASQRSLMTYLIEINKRLPGKVEGNMDAPGLVSRTGGFAKSVRAVDVQKSKKGYPSIGYTYQKNPYQIFEPGQGTKPWASTERDPRQLIDRSLREIAVELALGRFYTRRL